MTGLYVSNRTIGLYGSIKSTLIWLSILYILWGLGWFWVTPPGLRELPIFIPFVALTALIYVVLYPIELVTNMSLAQPTLAHAMSLLNSIGILEVIMNFGRFQK